jgi:activator of 2-hydroxyglutaryl-CoA dehydratase
MFRSKKYILISRYQLNKLLRLIVVRKHKLVWLVGNLTILQSRRIRVGIDVGGTFTKAVAIEIVTGRIMGKVTVPTTHSSSNGVSDGIIEHLRHWFKNIQFKTLRSN